MSWDDKVLTQEQDQRTYENSAEARRVTQVDASGNTFDSNNPLPVKEVGFQDTNNEPTELLLANGVFKGLATDVSSHSSIGVWITSDVASADKGAVAQFSKTGSTDDLDWHDGEAYTIIAGAEKFYTPTIQGKYFRIKYTNGTVDQGTFDIQVVMRSDLIKSSSHNINIPIAGEDDAELTKSVLTGLYDDAFINIEASVGGALKTAIEDGQTTRRVEIEPLGSMKTITPVRLVGTSFNNGTKDTNFWTETTTLSGSVTQAGQITLATGTTATASAIYDSVRKARKVTGTTNQFRAVGRLVTIPQENNYRAIGAFDANNGFFFQVEGTVLSVCSRKNGVDNVISSGSFNGNAGTTSDANTDLNRFVIDYTAVSAKFFINGILLHSLSSNEGSLTNTLDLPIRMINYNTGTNTTDNSFEIRFATVLRLGELITNPAVKYIGTNTTTVLKYGAGILQRIVNTDNAGTVVVYDGIDATGTIISSIDSAKALGDLNFNAPFNNGLTIVTAGGAQITVVYE